MPTLPQSSKFIDLTGRTYGRLTVVRFVRRALYPSGQAQMIWLTQCACGTQKTIRGSDLTSGRTQSCGCLRNERTRAAKLTHGMSQTPTYECWQHMKRRCNDTSNKSYADYGGRGIRVCQRWLKFENFLADMGPKPDGLTIDRRDNSRGYEPGNCYWATRDQQNNNTRRNVVLTFEGITLTAKQWSDRQGIGYHTLIWRINAGFPIEQILHKGKLCRTRIQASL